MSFPRSGTFDYFEGVRPLATVQKPTGTFDYFIGNRPIPTGSDNGFFARIYYDIIGQAH